MVNIRLSFVERFSIRDASVGLNEPSGLAISKEGDALWTVSDDTSRLFKLDMSGKLLKGSSLEVDQVGLEGITLDNAGHYLYVVQEEGNVVLKVSLANGQTVASCRLAEMAGYERIEKQFADADENKGLEGIAVDSRGQLFMLKEGIPGLLMEVTPTLKEIVSARKLNKKRGFTDDDTKSKKIDFSGLCYDEKRDAFWIVSDNARRIYLYSWERDEVVYHSPLTYEVNGKSKTVKKAEGVAFSAPRKRLYVVSDKEVRLYVYDIQAINEPLCR